jgi:transposase
MERREILREQIAAQSLEATVEQILALEDVLRRQQEELQKKEEQLAEARAFLEELKRQLFGSKAEKLSPEQEAQVQEIFDDLREQQKRPEPISQQVLEEERKAQQRRRPPRNPIPVQLETQTEIIEPEITSCSCCGPLKRIGEEVTEEMDWVPAKLIRRRIVRPKYAACRCGQRGMTIAPLPPRLLPQSELGLGLAVHIVISRYDDHLSFYWLEQIFRERHGVRIPRSQMVQWVEHIAGWLKPLYDVMWKDMKAGGYVQIDETPVKVLDPEVKGKAAQGYLWFYAVPGQDVILEFSRSRGQAVPLARLEGFRGTIQSDAYEVYSALERKQTGLLQRIACLAHSRRLFYQALQESFPEALWFILRIRELYRIEDQIRGCVAEDRYRVRLEQAPAIWERLEQKAQELQPQLLPKSTLGKAVHYFLNEYSALRGYLKHGRFEIDNNLVENDIRPTAVGRKRWLFIGHPKAGWRSAVIYSMLISARRRGLNPHAYLTDILKRLPSMKITHIRELLPGNWKPPSVSSLTQAGANPSGHTLP